MEAENLSLKIDDAISDDTAYILGAAVYLAFAEQSGHGWELRGPNNFVPYILSDEQAILYKCGFEAMRDFVKAPKVSHFVTGNIAMLKRPKEEKA